MIQAIKSGFSTSTPYALWRISIIFACFVVLVNLGDAVLVADGVPPWYLPAGFRFALLLVLGIRWLPLIVMAEFAAHLAWAQWFNFSIPYGPLLVQVAVGGAAHAAIIHPLLHRRDIRDFSVIPRLVGSMVLAPLAGTVVSAGLLIGASGFSLETARLIWVSLFLGDMAAIFTLAPALLALRSLIAEGWPRGTRVVRVVLHAAFMAAATWMLSWLVGWGGALSAAAPSYYLAIIWAAMAFGWRGAALVCAVVNATMMMNVEIVSPLFLQWHMILNVLIGLLAGWTIDEKNHAAVKLEQMVEERTAQLQAAKDAAELANRAKMRVLAVAGHDLRQPLQALSLFADVLEIRNVLGPAEQPLLANIRSSLTNVGRMLDAVLDMAKIEAGLMMARPQAVNVGEVLSRIHAEYAPVAVRKSVSLRVVASTAQVISDPGMLDRIVRNLVANAIRYTNAGGVVLLGARNSGDDLRIEVWDQGVGISADKLSVIFEDFSQVGDCSAHAEGLGLGLSIVRQLCGLLGHELTVRSTTGKGSVFLIRLPRAKKQGALQWQGAFSLEGVPPIAPAR